MSLKKAITDFVPASLKPAALRLRDALRGVEDRVSALYLEPARRRRREIALAPGPRRKVTLFLAPEAALEPFFASHALLARVLQDAGHEAIILSCGGLQPTCSAKTAYQLEPNPPGKADEPLCVRCRAVMRKVGYQYGLTDIPIEEILTPQMRARIETIMAENDKAPWSVELDGMQIGRACLGETLRMQRKLSIAEMSDHDISVVKALLYSALAIHFSVAALADTFDIERIAYFGDYAYFIAPQLFARRHGIPVLNISHAYNRDIDRRFLNLRPGNGFINMLQQMDDWPLHRDQPITPALVAQIVDGGLYRLYGFGGASTYSPNWKKSPGNLPEELGLPPGGKILVAYSNSTDELLCNRELLGVMGVPYYDNTPNPFASQVEWLQALSAWVGARKDLRLIIRLHPRMAKGHRHVSESSEAALMRKELANLPANVVVVWPESKVSSYNIAEHAAVALSAWSSIGLELARFGVPVVSAFQRVGPWPNTSFNLFAPTPEGYFQTIEQALSSRPALDAIMEAYRWTHYQHWAPLIDISDVTPEPDYGRVPPFRTPRNTETILAVVAQGADLLALNMAKLPTGPEALRAEHAALQVSLGRALIYFLSGVPDSSHPGYRIVEGGRDVTIGSPGQDAPVFHIREGDEIFLSAGADKFHRHSPLAVRLARAITNGSILS